MVKWAYLLVAPLALGPMTLSAASAQQLAVAKSQASSEVPAPALSQAELEQIVAPIALYPDDLLTQVLVASTYPLEVVMAARWVQVPGNAKLRGDALIQALDSQDWDASVKSLAPFPTVLKMMSEQLDWTQKLGDTFLAQQGEVFAAVQALRRRAQAAGALKSNAQQTVTEQGSAYVIQPAQPDTVYVPVYNPSVVYGAWPNPAYPPVYYPPPPGAYLGPALATGIAFGAGIALTGALWGWGSPTWGNGGVHVNVNQFNSINANRYNSFHSNHAAISSSKWQHNSAHRRGVAYSNPQIRQQNRPNATANAAQRDAFRGRASAGSTSLGQAGQRTANRSNFGNGQRPAGGGNPSNIQRPNAGGAAQGRLQNAPRNGGGQQFAARSQNFQRPVGAPAFQGVGNGAATRAQSAQGRASRASIPRNSGGGFRGGGGGHRGGRR